MNKTYFISDTHFGDNEKGIIAFERRPFKNKTDMVQKLIANWNKVVSDNDTIYHLGDVFWGLNDAERFAIIKELNGRKCLVMGNHDRDKDTEYWLNIGFDKVYDVPIIIEKFFILSHEPLYMTTGPYANIFGHVHGDKAYKDFSETSFCACVERETMKYKPISLDDIRKYVYSTFN